MGELSTAREALEMNRKTAHSSHFLHLMPGKVGDECKAKFLRHNDVFVLIEVVGAL